MPDRPSNSTVLPFVTPTFCVQPPGTSSTYWPGMPTLRESQRARLGALDDADDAPRPSR